MPRQLLFSLFVICLFSFKWSIIATVGSGLRIDDLLIVFVSLYGVLYTIRNFDCEFKNVSSLTLFFFLYIAVCLISSLYNSYVGRVSLITSLLYSFRGLEYWFFVVLGVKFAKHNIRLEKIFCYYVLYAMAIVALQRFHVLPVISGFSTQRAIANTGGPWELAAISAFFSIYFFYNKNWGYFGGSLCLLILTESRITLAAFILFLFWQLFSGFSFFKKYKRSRVLVLCTVLLVSCVGVLSKGVFLQINNSNLLESSEVTTPKDSKGVLSRYSSIFSENSRDALLDIVDKFAAVKTRQEYADLTYTSSFLDNAGESGGDASAIIRFSRWIILIKSTLDSMDSLWLGLGPSFAGLAVDGNYTRIFSETGLVGLITFLFFSMYALHYLRKRKEFILFWYYFCLCITASFIDVFVTYKAMMLFWFFYGYRLHFLKQNYNNSIKSY